MHWAQHWETSFDTFWDTTSAFTRSCIHNTQLRRQAYEAADDAAENAKATSFIDQHTNLPDDFISTSLENDNEDDAFDDFVPTIFPFQEKKKVLGWTQACLHVGVHAGLIPPIPTNHPPPTHLTFSNNGILTSDASLKSWLTDMDNHTETIVTT